MGYLRVVVVKDGIGDQLRVALTSRQRLARLLGAEDLKLELPS